MLSASMVVPVSHVTIDRTGDACKAGQKTLQKRETEGTYRERQSRSGSTLAASRREDYLVASAQRARRIDARMHGQKL